ncbi:hypothetical protein BJ165DRAFT_1444972 [Panaeolus papilionaceus]|nr:hypothetical protein BJ165DRAFT_1444972 [Panaeolus papilionaceus]
MAFASEIYKQHVWDLQCSFLRNPENWEYLVEGFSYLFCYTIASSDWDEFTTIRPDEGLFLLCQSLTANNFERRQRVAANVVRFICTLGHGGVSMGRVFDNVHFRACLDFLMSEVGRELEDFAAPGISRFLERSSWLTAMDNYGVDDKYAGLFGVEDSAL